LWCRIVSVMPKCLVAEVSGSHHDGHSNENVKTYEPRLYQKRSAMENG